MYRRILVGTDGSPTAAKAVQRAVELAASTGASLTIASAGAAARAEAVVADAARAHEQANVVIETRVLAGDPATALVEAADGYDLLVVGNKGMAGPSRFLVGSVPNKVSHHSPIALLIVRTT